MVSKVLGFFRFMAICFSVSVVVYFAYMGYVKATQQSEKGISLFGKNSYTFDTFLNNLRDENTPNYDEHRRLYKTLHTLEKEHLGDIQKNSKVPYDYQFFFQEVVPVFLQNSFQSQNPIEGKGAILGTFPRDEEYAAKLLLLSGPESRILKGTRRIKAYPKRLEMTATYTSEFQHPTGLFAIDGEIINPVLQKWDGLVILDASGKLHIKDIHTLEYQFRRFDILRSYQDYLDFLKLVEELKLSIFQSHLIVKHGALDASPEGQKRFRRRVIFQDHNYAVAIYDSFDKHLTLYELAEILTTHYHALDAVNLDMGPYGYCGRYENNKRLRLYGGKGENVQLSNIIIFNYN